MKQQPISRVDHDEYGYVFEPFTNKEKYTHVAKAYVYAKGDPRAGTYHWFPRYIKDHGNMWDGAMLEDYGFERYPSEHWGSETDMIQGQLYMSEIVSDYCACVLLKIADTSTYFVFIEEVEDLFRFVREMKDTVEAAYYMEQRAPVK